VPNSVLPDQKNLPRHIAVIMDGNGRWAKKRGLPRIFGHKAGLGTVRKIVEACVKLKIEHLTLYAFSTENWIRPHSEVNGLMNLLKIYVRKELKDLQKNNVRLSAIGDISKLPSGARAELQKGINETSGNTGLGLNLALNYGSRQEIVRAFNLMAERGMRKIEESDISDFLYTAGMPDPDLLIRTSGELRISNFLLWQIAYSELYITPVLWPDFSEKHLIEAIAEYQRRDRRFGGAK